MKCDPALSWLCSVVTILHCLLNVDAIQRGYGIYLSRGAPTDNNVGLPQGVKNWHVKWSIRCIPATDGLTAVYGSLTAAPR